MNAQQRLFFETLLRQERSSVVGVLDGIESAALTVAGDSADTPGDDTRAGTAGAGPEDDAAIAARERAALAAIDGALQLIEKFPDQYGKCTVCGRQIPIARLEIVPTTRRCEAHPMHE